MIKICLDTVGGSTDELKTAPIYEEVLSASVARGSEHLGLYTVPLCEKPVLMKLSSIMPMYHKQVPLGVSHPPHPAVPTALASYYKIEKLRLQCMNFDFEGSYYSK